MEKKDLSKLWSTIQKTTIEATEKVSDMASNIVSSTQQAIEATSEKIGAEIAQKKREAEKPRLDAIAKAQEYINGTIGARMLEVLDAKPAELSARKLHNIHEIFPIPREQCILWADAEFDLRPSGIACTEQGVFIRSNTTVWTFHNKPKENAETKDAAPEKATLYFYPWSEFSPDWFIGDTAESNTALTVEPQCSERFISGCKELVAYEEKIRKLYYTTLDQHLDHAESIVTKVAPISAAAVESAQAAVFVEQKAAINTPAGHGEMAEEAITLLDRLQGLDATVVGRDNAKDGADRLIGSDIFIQTKYYKTARGSLEACFNPETKQYRYMNGDTPMQLEVPKDQYERVLEGFKKKIADGKVPGVSDPNEAYNIVREGRLTYQQAVNLTKPGTIESLAYDAMTGAVTCSCALGLTFVVTVFLTWRRTGNLQEAIQAGASAGIQVFGISFIQHMVVSQVARTSLANSLMAPSQYIVGKLGMQSSATIVNGIRALSGKGAIYGAAASKHLAKILRSNVLTSALTFVVFSVPETYNLASRKISSAQYTKNMSVLAGSIVGGAGGAVAAGVAAAKIAGAAGTTVAPGVGTAVGIVGGFVGGVVGAKAVDIVGDIFHEDDVETWSRLFNAYVSCLITEYMLDGQEIDKLVSKLDSIKQKEFKALFDSLQKAPEQEQIIRSFLEPHFDAVISEREPFSLPSGDEIVEAVIST